MTSSPMLDAVVVGAGPNGLAAAITLARAGHSVLVLEASDTIGGGVRSASLTLPGFVHDVCSAVYPMGVGSPFFRGLALAAHGVEWVEPELPLAHPLDDGDAAVLYRSLDRTAAGLGEDGAAYARIVGDLVERWRTLLADSAPDRPPGSPSPWRVLRPGLAAIRTLALALGSADRLARHRLRTQAGRALVGGLGAHGIQPLTKIATGGFVLTLGAAAHAAGWPLVRGGAQRLADGLASVLRSHGGAIVTGRRVRSLADLPPARVVLLDVSPAQLLALAAERLPARAHRALGRFRRGPGTFKIDYALARAIPWRAAACRRAGIVHVGGSLDEIETSLADAWRGVVPAQPFLLVAQPSLFDRSRAPAGTEHHTAWVYCHVPHGSTHDMTGAIEAQLERFAPGFTASVLARHVLDPAGLQAHNVNLEGGDIAGGACDLRQLLFRPTGRLVPWSTPDPRVFLCSASTPPGPGVHGLCGFFAARVAMRTLRRR